LAAFFGLLWFAGAGFAVAETNSHPSSEILYANVPAADDAQPVVVLVRPVGAGSAIQFDVVVDEDHTISFVSAFGVGRRAVCEAIFLDDDTWMATCDVFDVTFSSFSELMVEKPTCPGCTYISRYAAGAHDGPCGPTFLRQTHGFAPDNDRIGLQALAEIASWTDDEVVALRRALELTGANGCPRLCAELRSLIGLVRAPELSESDFSTTDAVPKAIANQLDFDRRQGLDRWLEHVVATLP
jgi:hypothetical protein